MSDIMKYVVILNDYLTAVLSCDIVSKVNWIQFGTSRSYPLLTWI